jgi:hypothetical protein
MKKLFDQETYDKTKSREKLPFECRYCKQKFLKEKKYVQVFMNGNGSNGTTCEFCSIKCRNHFRNPPVPINCAQCKQEFKIKPCEIKKSKSGNNFCSRSCAATYNNLHKKTGTRRSKLEVWLESKLPDKYQTLDFCFNKKTAIGSELDIYIPSLKLAFELNGIYHYEPIHGLKKFSQIQNNDKNKFQLCIENEISLCIIDVTSMNYFKETKALPFLNIITAIIDKKLGG